VPAGYDDTAAVVDIDYDKELERLQSQLRLGKESLAYSSDEDLISSPRTRTRTRRHRTRTPSPTPKPHQPHKPYTDINMKEEEWSPAFLRRHGSAHRRHTADSGNLREEEVEEEMLVPPIHGAMPVPATPSLIRAVDRIVVAQREAFGGTTKGVHLEEAPALDEDVRRLRVEDPPITGREREGGEQAREQQQKQKSWDAFWRDVRVKAGQN
jgi:hypothetical protein